jgi:DNA-binding transcriptional MerR regulator
MLEKLLGPWRDREDLKLDDLVHAAAEVIPRLANRPDYGRATAIPDARTVRYYIQQGLVDRPHGSAGTAALYGYRHLLQLVAVKVLQGQYMPMERIREAISGLENRGLEAQLAGWAATPREMWVTSPGDWGARRMRSWARGFAKMTKRAALDERMARADSLQDACATSEPEALPRSRPPNGPEQSSDLTVGSVVFEQSMRNDEVDGDVPAAPEQSSGESQDWQRYELHPGVELHVREGAALPASASFLSALASRLRAILSRRARKK